MYAHDTCSFYYANICLLVNGDANFTMEKTNLVVAGFSQPSVSRALIEFVGNTEKGLSQRFFLNHPMPTLQPWNLSMKFSQNKLVQYMYIHGYICTCTCIAII